MVRQVRTIDISGYNDPQQRKKIAAELFEAAKDIGFFYVTGEDPVCCCQ